MAVYLNFSVKFHGKDLPKDIVDLEVMRKALEMYAKGLHPGREFDDDVTVELEESAGELEE